MFAYFFNRPLPPEIEGLAELALNPEQRQHYPICPLVGSDVSGAHTVRTYRATVS